MEDKVEEILEILKTFEYYNSKYLDEDDMYELNKQIEFWEDFLKEK